MFHWKGKVDPVCWTNYRFCLSDDKPSQHKEKQSGKIAHKIRLYFPLLYTSYNEVELFNIIIFFSFFIYHYIPQKISIRKFSIAIIYKNFK